MTSVRRSSLVRLPFVFIYTGSTSACALLAIIAAPEYTSVVLGSTFGFRAPWGNMQTSSPSERSLTERFIEPTSFCPRRTEYAPSDERNFDIIGIRKAPLLPYLTRRCVTADSI